MKERVFSPNRRRLIKMMTLTALGVAGSPVDWLRAMGPRVYPQGMFEIQGEVKINGTLSRAGDVVKVGDVVTTGQAALAIFVVEKDVYLLHANTRLELSVETEPVAEKQIVQILRLVSGKMLAVFGAGRKRILTDTMVAGVRGTGLYAEIESDRTYLCTCYGRVDIEPKGFPQDRQELHTTHHESPLYIYTSGQRNTRIERAPVKNHTDKELIHLESIVGRMPPFALSGDKDGNKGRY